ncbi:Translationally-controlled tumor -like protein [Halotydeus destructor]|nr:Translationally-controlled tumor -like protein [Halotydeus destructor]
MKIYRCLITGDEMLSDTNKITLIHDAVYQVECNQINNKLADVVLAGANASAEDPADEGTDALVESGIDLIVYSRLKETGFGDKKSYLMYFKTYAKELKLKWKELEWTDEQIAEAGKKMENAVKAMLPRFKEYQFFTGEEMNPDGAIGLLDYVENKPIMYFFKDGLQEEKV